MNKRSAAARKMGKALEANTSYFDGPFAVVRACNHCKYSNVRRKVRGAGCGAGFREGNKQRGDLYQHLKSEHPELFTEQTE